MVPLLGRESFPGEWISAESAGASWVGEAHFDGVVVVTLWDRADVVALLPSAWHAAGHAERLDRHPVVFTLGRQRRTAVLFGGMRLPSDADYGEAMIAVPFVTRERGGGLHTFVPRMYASDRRATWSGNAFYGLGKRMAGVERFGGSLTVVDANEGLLLHATTCPKGPWVAGRDCASTAAVSFLRDAFRCPVVGRREDGGEVTSYFDWSFETAAVRPVDAVVVLDAALGDGFEPGTLGTARDVALEVWGMRWRLSWPDACRQ